MVVMMVYPTRPAGWDASSAGPSSEATNWPLYKPGE